MDEFGIEGQPRTEPIRGLGGRAGLLRLVMPGSSRARHSLVYRRVLVVDDDEDEREVVGTVLTQHGYDVTFATNGLEALDYLSHAPAPFVIVLDLVMPEKDGWAFLLERSRDVALSAIPVIVVSGAVSGARMPKGATLVNAVYLAKPLHADELLRAIGALLH